MPRISRNIRKQRIKQDLFEQLERDGKTASFWYDLAEDYLSFWETKEKLKTEIERNGAMLTVKNGQQTFRKRNDAVVEMPKISKRMTDILEVLDVKVDEPPSNDEGGGNDDSNV